MRDDPEPIVLALDGGSTKTDAVLVAADGTLLGRSRVGPSNHQLVGLDGAMDAAGRGDRRRHRGRRHQRATVPLVRCRRVLPGRPRPSDRRRTSRAGDRTAGMDRIGPLVQRHLRRLAGGHDLDLGHRRRLRDRTELRRHRPRRGDGALSCSGRALRGFCPRRLLAGGAGLGPGAPGRGRTRVTHGARAHVCPRISTSSMPKPSSPVSTAAPSPTGGCSNWRACCSTPPQRAMPPHARRRTRWPTKWPPSPRRRSPGLACADAAVEVVLGGGIFDTHDAGFHARVADGIHAVAPRAVLRRLTVPPVLGAALLGLDAIGADDRGQGPTAHRPHERLTRDSPIPLLIPIAMPARWAERYVPALPRPAVDACGCGLMGNGVFEHLLVIGQKRTGEFFHQFDDLGMFRRIPSFEQLGQPGATRFGQAVHGGQPGRCQIHVVVVAALHHDDHARRDQPPHGLLEDLTADLQARSHLLHRLARVDPPDGRAASTTAAVGRFPLVAPSSGTARRGSPGWRSARVTIQFLGATNEARAARNLR